jgi:hypothetical protein
VTSDYLVRDLDLRRHLRLRYIQDAAVREELNSIKANRIQLPSIAADEDSATLSAKDKNLKKKLANLDGLIKDQLYATYFLISYPRLADGIWLSKFISTRKEDGRPEVIIEGEAYLGDSDKEFEAVSAFLSNLRATSSFQEFQGNNLLPLTANDA